MMATDQAMANGRRPREVTGRMVFVCLVAFFGVVAGVNGIMIKFAVSTFGGVETEGAYQAGLAFAREAAAVEAQDALHWQVRAKVSTAPDATLVELVARDANDRPLAGLDATARLVHPTDKRADHDVPLDEAAAGTFRGHGEPVYGQWALVIELSRGGNTIFRSRNRVFLK
jgi:nitrogen fixation protein FixH